MCDRPRQPCQIYEGGPPPVLNCWGVLNSNTQSWDDQPENIWPMEVGCRSRLCTRGLGAIGIDREPRGTPWD
eukprot:595926-Amphidinium_carterae.1